MFSPQRLAGGRGAKSDENWAARHVQCYDSPPASSDLRCKHQFGDRTVYQTTFWGAHYGVLVLSDHSDICILVTLWALIEQADTYGFLSTSGTSKSIPVEQRQQLFGEHALQFIDGGPLATTGHNHLPFCLEVGCPGFAQVALTRQGGPTPVEPSNLPQGPGCLACLGVLEHHPFGYGAIVPGRLGRLQIL